MPHLLTVLVLATSPSPSPSGSGAAVPPDDTVSPGLLGFLSFLFLGIAVFLIARGLTKQLKRVTFDEDAVNSEHAPDTSAKSPSPSPVAPHEAGPAPRDSSEAEPAPDAEQTEV